VKGPRRGREGTHDEKRHKCRGLDESHGKEKKERADEGGLFTKGNRFEGREEMVKWVEGKALEKNVPLGCVTSFHVAEN